MSLSNDYIKQAEKSEFNAQQARLQGDTRNADFYEASAKRALMHAANAKMAEEQRAGYQPTHRQPSCGDDFDFAEWMKAHPVGGKIYVVACIAIFIAAFVFL